MNPILDLETLRRAAAAGDTLVYRLFWGHRARKDGQLGDACFSQWWRCRFIVNEQMYSSAEHFMMAAKARLFGDETTRTAILAAADPGAAKSLGRKVRGFEPTVWDAARFDIVTAGNVAKFGQDDRLRAYLLATGDEILVEASPVDAVWGIGLPAAHADARTPERWPGQNLLGFALMRARGILRGELPGIDGATNGDVPDAHLQPC